MVVAALAGCTGLRGNTVPGSIEGTLPVTGAFVPNTTVQVTPSYGFTLEQLAVTGLAGYILYAVYQPFAPNWNIEEAALNGDTFYVRMQAKSFRTGGDGEAMMVLRRRAAQLQRERGYAGYRIVDYSEGIQSSTPFTQRYSEGIVQMVRADAVKP